MLLERLMLHIAPTATENTNTSADFTPVRSLTSVAQQLTPNLALDPQQEAKSVLEAMSQLSSSPAPYPIQNPVSPAANSLGLHWPVQFRPVSENGGFVSGLIGNGRIEADLLERGKLAGLNPDELNRLQQILDSSPDFKADAALLKEVLTSWPDNADRAVRTFMDLDQMRKAHPDRITPDVVSSLVEGVAKSKSPGDEAEWEGVLGEASADRAAQALIAMPQGDYDAIKGMLSQAGKGGDPVYDDPLTERALILKAVAARAGEYEHPTVNDSQLRSETLEIETFANQIRGMDRDELIFRTTTAATGDTLEQRYSNSCAPTMAQIARAEADPIYAWKLHDENVDSQDLGGFIGNQQAQMMMDVGGNPVTPQQLALLDQMSKQGGIVGATAKAMEDALGKNGSYPEPLANQFVSDVTGRHYNYNSVDNSVSARTAAVDQIAKLASQGVDVPITVNWEEKDALHPFGSLVDNGIGHALVITDVRGQGADQVFVVADPGGRTYEVSRNDLIAGTNFNGANGRLSGFLS